MEEEGKTNTGGEGESRPIGLRTFSSDVAEAVKREQGSIIKVAVPAQKIICRRPRRPKVQSSMPTFIRDW
ncbi:MAG: hypothetical protein UV08_C0013G0019 [Parcubacteria group bacterium GW2011_GWA2_42_18]|nr:MAG: hypothetical protein UV08_C0013G0019 [Parcubacteria group bacterium GW2011_GWA2_42_18]